MVVVNLDLVRKVIIIGHLITLLVGIVLFPVGVYRIVVSLSIPSFQAGVVLLLVSFLSLAMAFLFYVLLQRIDTIQLEIYRDSVRSDLNELWRTCNYVKDFAYQTIPHRLDDIEGRLVRLEKIHGVFGVREEEDEG